MAACGQGPKAGASVAQAEHNPAAAIMEQPMLDPHSNGIGPDFDFCRKYVWTNLLYVSNLYPHQFGINPQVFMEVEYPDQHGHMVKHKVPDYMDRPNLGCMGHSWYLSNDFQMHMLTPWLLLLFRKNNAAGYLLMSAIIAGSLGYIGFLVGEWRYGLCSQQLQDPPGGHVTPAQPHGGGYNQATLFYGKPWCRVGPFMLGVMLACYQSVNSNKAVRANRFERICLSSRRADSGCVLHRATCALLACPSSVSATSSQASSCSSASSRRGGLSLRTGRRGSAAGPQAGTASTQSRRRPCGAPRSAS